MQGKYLNYGVSTLIWFYLRFKNIKPSSSIIRIISLNFLNKMSSVFFSSSVPFVLEFSRRDSLQSIQRDSWQQRELPWELPCANRHPHDCRDKKIITQEYLPWVQPSCALSKWCYNNTWDNLGSWEHQHRAHRHVQKLPLKVTAKGQPGYRHKLVWS